MSAKDYVLQLVHFECAKGYLFRGNNLLQLVPYQPGNNLSLQGSWGVKSLQYAPKAAIGTIASKTLVNFSCLILQSLKFGPPTDLSLATK
jgi:hypothetical protein